MRAPLDDSTLAALLPGSWTIAATNLPVWLSGERGNPLFAYEIAGDDPLVLDSDVSFVDAEGIERHILGTDTVKGDHFVWRGKGLLKVGKSRWHVAGASDDATVAALRFSASAVTPAGINIIVKSATHHAELRALIARSTELFGLSPEDFGSLTWLATPQG